jgi:hypothetical protein
MVLRKKDWILSIHLWYPAGQKVSTLINKDGTPDNPEKWGSIFKPIQAGAEELM